MLSSVRRREGVGLLPAGLVGQVGPPARGDLGRDRVRGDLGRDRVKGDLGRDRVRGDLGRDRVRFEVGVRV